MDEKLYKNILVYDILYKLLLGAKQLCIMFCKLNGFIRDYDWTKYFNILVFFGAEKYDAIFDRITYFKGLNSSIAYVSSFNYTNIKTDSDDDFPVQKTLTMYYVIKLIKSVLNKNHNHYYYKTFLEKCSYHLA